MEYTRELFISLLEKHFGEVKHNSRYYIEGYDNKEVAEMLDYSEKQFGHCLNPSDKDVSYQTVIRRLVKLDKIKDLEGQVGELRAENKVLREGEGRGKAILFLVSVLGLAAIVLVILNFFWLPPKMKDTLAGYVHSQPQRYVVRDAATLEKIMQWHGKMIVNQLALEAVLINSRIKDEKSELTPEQTMKYIEEAKGIVKNVIKDERIGLHSLGFVNEKGENIAAFLQEVAPYDSLFLASDPLFSAAFKQAIPYVTSQHEPYSMVSKQMMDVVKGVQGRTWSAMENRMFPLSK